MNKVLYFIIQLVLSVLFSSLNWYVFSISINLTSSSSEVSLTPAILFLGGLLFNLIFTVIYIIFGWKKVDEWRWWCILISAGISIASVILGFWGSAALVYTMRYNSYI